MILGGLTSVIPRCRRTPGVSQNSGWLLSLLSMLVPLRAYILFIPSNLNIFHSIQHFVSTTSNVTILSNDGYHSASYYSNKKYFYVYVLYTNYKRFILFLESVEIVMTTINITPIELLCS